METSEWVFLVAFFTVVIVVGIIVFIKFVLKPSLKRMRISTYFGFKHAKVTFIAFDSFVSHSLLVSPKEKYEVVYRLETEEGKINLKLDGQLNITTDSKKEGSEIISFSRMKPIVSFEGYKATNGECSVKIYKIR